MRPSIPGLIAGGATVAGLAAVLILNPTQAASSTDSSDLSAPQVASSANTTGRTQQDTSSAPSTQSSAEGTTPAQETSQAGNEAASSAGNDSSTAADGTYTGSVYSSPYGDMQVQVTMSAGTITQIQWLQLPSDGHSQRINSRAAQTLIDEAIQAQSADVASVSGATYTSEGFKSSLQAALAQAGLS